MLRHNGGVEKFIPNTAQITAFLLTFLTAVILVAIFGGTIHAFLNLELLFTDNLEVALREGVISVMAVLAMVEVLRTVQEYVQSHRVKVHYVIDTILIIMLKEVMTAWFKDDFGMQKISLLLVVITVLMIVRIISVRFSLENE